MTMPKDFKDFYGPSNNYYISSTISSTAPTLAPNEQEYFNQLIALDLESILDRGIGESTCKQTASKSGKIFLKPSKKKAVTTAEKGLKPCKISAMLCGKLARMDTFAGNTSQELGMGSEMSL